MPSFNDFITFEYRHEHVLEHDPEHVLEHDFDFNIQQKLTKRLPYSPPKIYDAKGDLSKRWYVYFSYRNPKDGKLTRMKNIYGNVNQYKTKRDRLALLSKYSSRLLRLLELGFNPYQDNLEKFLESKKRISAQDQKGQVVVQEKPSLQNIPVQTSSGSNQSNSVKEEEKKVIPKDMLIKNAFMDALERKTPGVKQSTIQGYTYSVNSFLDFMKKKYPKLKSIDQIDKKVAQSFMTERKKSVGAKTYNNTRINLSAVMQDMVDHDLLDTHPFEKIKNLKTQPLRHKTYKPEEVKKIFDYLKDADPILLLYVQFIAYGIFRPLEVNRLKIGDIDLVNKQVELKTKTRKRIIKRLPRILLDVLPDLSHLDSNNYLFTPTEIGGVWDASENNRRDHFSKRYKFVVKDKFKMHKDYTLYSFRHTFISFIYAELRKQHSQFAAKSLLMEITGHQTLTALDKYLRDHSIEIAEDHSHYLDNSIYGEL
ncbi:tyrosine-type recombinase/integrase [Mangrovimonas futianensis]|uniref:tyrosine-type recombinase/integrase n=1 Tax=Mangrovimonas futianensis TaxID=2895523 RepID=UPI001E498AF9|nr:phage integrase N-terminal SAM-like domain-containing protein [Mangrovimonas futianensis]MCF1423239.1 site-specific integrase [Mangrovimonas futianensis]